MSILVASILMGLLGLIFGSFIAAVTVRMPRDEDIVFGRSRCMSCGETLKPWHLVPALSWLVQRGRCAIAATAVLGWQLLLIALIDAENFWLPDELTLPLIATGLAAAAVIAQAWPVAQLIGAVAGFVLLWALAEAYRRVRHRDGLGGGDPILFAGAGAWVGWTGLPTVLLWACAAGFSIVLTLLSTRRTVALTDRLPFGTFLAVGIWLTWLYGPFGG